jgi:hypothetical protein
VCDQCNGRPDDECFCGDAIVDEPSEECDLGAGLNGSPPCSDDCEVIGACTGSGDICETAAECPPGEGCCGNALQEGDEGCDDGNIVNDDLCTNSCAVNFGGALVFGCEDLGAGQLVPATTRPASLGRASILSDFDKWKVKGQFTLFSGPIDPDTQDVTIIFSQDVLLYEATLPPGNFTQLFSTKRPGWRFKLQKTQPDVVGAEGLRQADSVCPYRSMRALAPRGRPCCGRPFAWVTSAPRR